MASIRVLRYLLTAFNKKESNKILRSNKLPQAVDINSRSTFKWINLIHCPSGSRLIMFLTWCVFVMSVLRQYLVVVFRDKPLELWDIRTGTLLREMAKNFPTVTALVLTELCCKPAAITEILLIKQKVTRSYCKVEFITTYAHVLHVWSFPFYIL